MWDWLKSLWEDPAENFAGAYLAGRDGDPTLAMPIKADQQYFTITLECMHLVLAREAFTKFYGVLSGSVGFDLATGPQAITMIVSPEELKGVDKAQFGRVIVQTVPLCDRVPYIGSAIELRLALLALEATDLLNGIVDVLTSVASAAGVGYVEQAKVFLSPLEKGIALLRRQGGCEIGLYKTIADPTTGYFCVARTPSKRLALEKCRLSKTWDLIDPAGQVVTDVPYFVVRFQAFDKKGNFAAIPSIRDAYAKLHDAAIQGDEKAANEAFEFFRRNVLWSPDLFPADREEMIESARKRLEASFPAKRTATERARVTAARSFPKFEKLVPWS
jgi:hypothetical protein